MMANLKKNRLGAPPGPDKTLNNMSQPEHAPAQTPRTKTNRTYAFGTRVTKDFYRNLRLIAARDNLKIVEVLEKAIELYEKKMNCPT